MWWRRKELEEAFSFDSYKIVIFINKAIINDFHTHKLQLLPRVSVLFIRGPVIVRRSLSSQRFSAEAVESGGENITTMLEVIRLDAFLQVM
jgi:hypothetical protein